MAEHIPNEEIKIDLENTRKELVAYQQIADGFSVLAWLPENQGKSSLQNQMNLFYDKRDRCALLLAKLEKYAKERGVE